MTAIASTATVERLAQTHVAACYQCGKCSAGCPMAEQMDLLPHQLLRLVQLGRADRAMRSEAIWKCVSCVTCSTRCPKEVDCAAVIDALRQSAIEQGLASDEQFRTVIFQQAFLDNIRRNGRLCELELVGVFKAKTFFKRHDVPLLMKDAMLAPQLIRRRKLSLLGQRVRDRGVVRRIFEKCTPPAASANGNSHPG
jgi:heterodisulfide reductase subunit C2